MIILGIDPGATRCGWAFVRRDGEGRLSLLSSGVSPLPRGDKEDFQKYRERLLQFWVVESASLIRTLRDLTDAEGVEVMFEIVPAIGFQSGGAVQSQLAQVVVTVFQTMCEHLDVPWTQASATTIKKRATGYGSATKVQIRDAVILVFPALEERKRELTSTADESDAIAIALVGAGYSVPKAKGQNPRRKKRAKAQTQI